MYPTQRSDEDAIEVARSSGKASVNLYDFLAPDLLIEIGYKERYTVSYVKKEESPVGVDAILIDMTAPVERKPVASSRKTSATTQASAGI